MTLLDDKSKLSMQIVKNLAGRRTKVLGNPLGRKVDTLGHTGELLGPMFDQECVKVT